jgi:hypothetical protein
MNSMPIVGFGALAKRSNARLLRPICRLPLATSAVPPRRPAASALPWGNQGQNVSPKHSWQINNFQKFLEMLDGAQTGGDDTGNLVSS